MVLRRSKRCLMNMTNKDLKQTKNRGSTHQSRLVLHALQVRGSLPRSTWKYALGRAIQSIPNWNKSYSHRTSFWWSKGSSDHVFSHGLVCWALNEEWFDSFYRFEQQQIARYSYGNFDIRGLNWPNRGYMGKKFQDMGQGFSKKSFSDFLLSWSPTNKIEIRFL